MPKYYYDRLHGIITQDGDVKFEYRGQTLSVTKLRSDLKIISMLPSGPGTVNVFIREYNDDDSSGHILESIRGSVKPKKRPPS